MRLPTDPAVTTPDSRLATVPSPDALRGSAVGKKVGVLTSGGDAQGMNAALRAVVRTALHAGAQPYAIAEGYQGMIDGGDGLRAFAWEDASGILNRGGTVIGTFRSKEFTTRAGMLAAAANLVGAGIDRLVVIGGDGSLSGLDEFSQAWPSLLDELVSSGRIGADQRAAHPRLIYAGLAGSIDNDLVGTDMTIGVDSALHRIQAAIDAIASTAASHQRCFVIEVMGRHCGYLALASAISGGCDYVLIPELPPEEGWEEAMCQELRQSRAAGRKDSIVIVAEGATDRAGQPISAEHVRSTIADRLGEEARVTILGHVQRGGTPSAYDRWASTWLGYAAAAHVLTATGEDPASSAGAVAPGVQADATSSTAPTAAAEAGDGTGSPAGPATTTESTVAWSAAIAGTRTGPMSGPTVAGTGPDTTASPATATAEDRSASPTGSAPASGPVFGFHGEEIVQVPLLAAVADTHRVPRLIDLGDYQTAMTLRGNEFHDLARIFHELSSPARTQVQPGDRRIGIMHAGALAPGMNTAAKTAVWLSISRGFSPVGIHDGFVGLAAGEMTDLTWKDVDGWSQEGGAVLGTRRHVPTVEELYAVSRSLESGRIDALLVIGGWDAYAAVQLMNQERSRYPGLQIPIICLPASIDNNLPGTAMAIGADAALNVVVDCIDKIKMSASASQRCFVIETMGHDCGYLALMGGFAGGAEQVYLNETGITLDQLKGDIDWLKHSFDAHGRSLFVAVRNENANPNYTTDVLAHMFDQEGNGRYDTRTLTIGHIQQGGAPTPADRLLATRLTDAAITRLGEQIAGADRGIACAGSRRNEICLTGIQEAMGQADPAHQRPLDQWWLGLKPILDCLNRDAG